MATIIDDLWVSCAELPGGEVGRRSEMPPLFGHVVMAIPRYRSQPGPALLSAGFRPFFLLSAAWASLAVPVWVAAFAAQVAAANCVAAGCLARPRDGFRFCGCDRGRVPADRDSQLDRTHAVARWAARGPGGSVAIRPGGDAVVFVDRRRAAAALDLAFPLVFLGVIAREIIAGHNWRNLPMLAALACLLGGNALVHLDAVGLSDTAGVGNRIGVATLLMLISFVGGRIIPSFTRNWLVKQRPDVRPPAAFNWLDRVALALTAIALAFWVLAPTAPSCPGRAWRPALPMACGWHAGVALRRSASQCSGFCIWAMGGSRSGFSCSGSTR